MHERNTAILTYNKEDQHTLFESLNELSKILGQFSALEYGYKKYDNHQHAWSNRQNFASLTYKDKEKIELTISKISGLLQERTTINLVHNVEDQQILCSSLDVLIAYEDGFSAGYQSVEGSTYDSCQLTIQGYENYCPNNPDNPACADFLHDVSNKQPHSTIGACGQEPYHPGCPQIVNPERYCLVTDDAAFCKTIGDICDADGFVKPEDAYCTNRS